MLNSINKCIINKLFFQCTKYVLTALNLVCKGFLYIFAGARITQTLCKDPIFSGGKIY